MHMVIFRKIFSFLTPSESILGGNIPLVVVGGITLGAAVAIVISGIVGLLLIAGITTWCCPRTGLLLGKPMHGKPFHSCN